MPQPLFCLLIFDFFVILNNWNFIQLFDSIVNRNPLDKSISWRVNLKILQILIKRILKLIKTFQQLCLIFADKFRLLSANLRTIYCKIVLHGILFYPIGIRQQIKMIIFLKAKLKQYKKFSQYYIFMNKLFGFFKQKLIEAREENKQQLDNIVNALGNTEPYQSQKTLSHLQKIKENYMTWSILIANQASTGLFYSQVHNRNVCLKKIHTNKQSYSHKEKYQIVSEQMSKTHEQLKEISNLNNKWVKQTTSKMDSLIQMFEPLESSKKQSSSQTQINIESLKKKKSQKQISSFQQQKKKTQAQADSSQSQTGNKKYNKQINSEQIIL